jgi:hypothetical protein
MMIVKKILDVSISDNDSVIIVSDFKGMNRTQISTLVVRLEDLKQRLIKKWKLKNGEGDDD